jgi:hypothetical protein
MKDEKYKEIMEGLGMPQSRSLKLALEQVANETAQKINKKNEFYKSFYRENRIRDLESGNMPPTKYTFTDNLGREFNDKIPIEISPSDLERFYQTYKGKAEICRDYDTQKTYHKIVDFLKHHLSGYYSARKIFDSGK